VGPSAYGVLPCPGPDPRPDDQTFFGYGNHDPVLHLYRQLWNPENRRFYPDCALGKTPP